MMHIIQHKGIMLYHRGDWMFAVQGVHKARVQFEGDVVRDGNLRRMVEARAIAALVSAKVAQQQLQRPPAPDSRPRRCHAKPVGCRLVCRPCRLAWEALDGVYPACKGDE